MIVVGGENLIDFIQTPGDSGVPVYQAFPGGSPYNCAMAIGRQGAPIGYLSPISNDALGETLAERLQNSNVNLCGNRVPEPTSLAMVSLQDSIASYQFYRRNTADRMVNPASLMANCPAEISAFHTGSLAIADGTDATAWADFFASLHEQGVFTSLDPNIRPAFIKNRKSFLARLDRMLLATDLLKLSDEDLEWLDPKATVEVAAQNLLVRSSAQIVVVTLGADGAIAVTNNSTHRIPSSPVGDLKDTVGAGDTFMATLLAFLQSGGHFERSGPLDLDGVNIPQMLERAALAAALNCQSVGCNPPSLAALNAASA